MRRALTILLAGIAVVGAWVVFAEELTLTTYYPSPRGVYNELRANRYGGITGEEPFMLDMTTGALEVSRVILRDQVTGRRYGLFITEQRVVLQDIQEERNYILLDMRR